jgi:hypothetical protein
VCHLTPSPKPPRNVNNMNASWTDRKEQYTARNATSMGSLPRFQDYQDYQDYTHPSVQPH